MSGWADYTPGAPWGDSRAELTRLVTGALIDMPGSRCRGAAGKAQDVAEAVVDALENAERRPEGRLSDDG